MVNKSTMLPVSFQNRYFSQFAPAFALFCTIISGCYYTGTTIARYASCSTTACLNEGLLDTMKAGTAAFQQMYSDFLAGVDTSSRTTEIIGNLIREHVPAEGLKSTIIKDTGKWYFSLQISPDGKTEIMYSGVFCRIDTSALKKISLNVSRSVPV